jgi:hypothetical protein
VLAEAFEHPASFEFLHWMERGVVAVPAVAHIDGPK